MTERVNLETFINSTIASVQLSSFRMQKYQEKITTGKEINRASDDPAGARKVLSLRSEGLKLEQYSKNIISSIQSLEFTTSTLNGAADFLARAQELAIQGVNGATDQEGRDAVASEINGILESMLQVANTSRMGRYIFAGTKTTTTPFEVTRNSAGDISGVTYNGNREKIKYPVGPGFSSQVNQPGEEVFMDNNLLASIISLRDNLANGAVTLALDNLGDIKDAYTDVTQFIAKSGAVASALEFSDNRIADTKVALQATLGDLEGADLAEIILKLKEQEGILQAALASGMFMLNTSILDYM
ncbi:MAG: flagellar hook-associated protein FlgL [Candidatus Scalindua sp.]